MVEVKTGLNAENLRQANKVSIKKFMWLFIVLSVLLNLVGIVNIVSPDSETPVILPVFCIILGLLIFPGIIILIPVYQKLYNKTMKLINDETVNFFRFCDDKFYQEATKGTDFKDVCECGYSYIFKAIETNEHFFIYISKLQMHIIPKKNITLGTPMELRSILMGRLGAKFKIKCKQ